MAHANRRDRNYGENNHLPEVIEAARTAQAVAPNSRGLVSDGVAGVKLTETAARLAAAYHEAGHIVAALTQSLVDHGAAFVRTVEFRGPIVRENALPRRQVWVGQVPPRASAR